MIKQVNIRVSNSSIIFLLFITLLIILGCSEEKDRHRSTKRPEKQEVTPPPAQLPLSQQERQSQEEPLTPEEVTKILVEIDDEDILDIFNTDEIRMKASIEGTYFFNNFIYAGNKGYVSLEPLEGTIDSERILTDTGDWDAPRTLSGTFLGYFWTFKEIWGWEPEVAWQLAQNANTAITKLRNRAGGCSELVFTDKKQHIFALTCENLPGGEVVISRYGEKMVILTLKLLQPPPRPGIPQNSAPDVEVWFTTANLSKLLSHLR